MLLSIHPLSQAPRLCLLVLSLCLHRSVDVRAIVTEAARCRVQAVYRVYICIFPVVSAPKSHMMAAVYDDSRIAEFLYVKSKQISILRLARVVAKSSLLWRYSTPPCREMFFATFFQSFNTLYMQSLLTRQCWPPVWPDFRGAQTGTRARQGRVPRPSCARAVRPRVPRAFRRERDAARDERAAV
jgi:hypothetical protein